MNSCLNCNFAKWKMTKHDPPRINPRQYGNCVYRIILPLLPKAYNEDVNETENRFNGRYSRRAIWSQDAYTDCPVWEKA